MRPLHKTIVLATVAILMPRVNARAELILNEALANEPGSVTTTEWVEILNWPDTGAALSIKGYRYLDGGDTTKIDTNLILPPGGFLILARKVTGTASFESIWGNNSGVWGDAGSESYPVVGITKMSLRNSCDTITLIAPSGSTSVIWWKSDAGDGISVERIRPGPSDDIANFHSCIIADGATPARANSVLPGRHDLLLDTVSCSPAAPSWGDTITFVSTVQNYGTGPVDDAQYVYLRDRAPLHIDTSLIELMTQPLGFIEELGAAMPRWNWTDAPPGVSHLLCQIRGDSNSANNSVWVDIKVRFTSPLLIVSEFLANPGPGGPDEWIEIANVARFSVNLEGMRIGDSLNSEDIPTQSREIEPGEFWVLAENEAGFRAFYPDFTGTLIGIKGWRALNNSGDGIRLWGPSGEIVDSLTFRTTFEANRSVERVELAPSFARTRDWAGSTATDGATPGRANSIRRGQPGALLIDSMWIEPPFPHWGETVGILAATRNVGFGPTKGWTLGVLRDLDLSAPGSQLSLITQLNVPDLGEGERASLVAEWTDAPPGISRVVCVLYSPANERVDSSAIVMMVAYTQPLLIISEYMAVPAPSGPGEWVELYNASNLSFGFGGLKLGDSTAFTAVPAANGALGPGAFVVLCQDAEQFSGYYPTFAGDLLELPGWRPLGDQGDRIRLLGSLGEIIDSLSYVGAHAGNISTERRRLVPEFADPRDWGDCIDPEGATPGRSNSIRRLYRDLALDSIVIGDPRPSEANNFRFRAWVTNTGFATIDDADIIWRMTPGSHGDLSSHLPAIEPVSSIVVDLVVAGPAPGWNSLDVWLVPDDDTTNDRATASINIAFVSQALAITEYLANPTSEGPGEWVELSVVGARSFSRQGFEVSDFGHPVPWQDSTSADDPLLEPGEFLVLVQDEQAFRRYYPDFGSALIEVDNWPTLNNDLDVIMIADPSGMLQDSVWFGKTYGGNHSVERVQSSLPINWSHMWSECVDPAGGTPGRANSVNAATAGSLRIDVAPNPFYRSWGQRAQVNYRLQIGERLTLKIFDRDGHEVRTLADDRPSATGQTEWDGTNDEGLPLRPGPYIVWARSEPSGIEIKAVIVVGP